MLFLLAIVIPLAHVLANPCDVDAGAAPLGAPLVGNKAIVNDAILVDHFDRLAHRYYFAFWFFIHVLFILWFLGLHDCLPKLEQAKVGNGAIPYMQYHDALSCFGSSTGSAANFSSISSKASMLNPSLPIGTTACVWLCLISPSTVSVSP